MKTTGHIFVYLFRGITQTYQTMGDQAVLISGTNTVIAKYIPCFLYEMFLAMAHYEILTLTACLALMF